MDFAGEGTVRFVDVVLGGGGGNVEEGVEGCVGGFAGEEFVSEAEDFMVFFGPGGGQG